MSSFPISITWQVQTPPTTSFDQLAKSAQSLDQSLAASSQKFDDFGQTVSRLESPLGSVGGSMGELSGNMGELEGTLDGAGSGMEDLAGATEDLNGSIGDVASGVEDAAGGMDDLGSGAEDAAGGMEDLSSGAEDTGSALEGMSTSLEDTTGALEQTVPALEETSTGLEDTTTALDETVPALEDTNAALEETVPALEDTSTALEDTVPALEDTNTALEDTVPALEDTASALEDTVPAAEDTATAFEDAAPAIEDTGTAFEDTAPSIEDTSTALEDMGTAVEDSVTATEDFTGALSGMNDANEGVTGGLTENNTLMGNLATSTDTTAGSTENLKGSFGRVALGMAGAVGAGVALFNMYDQIGDSQVQVDAANIRLERSQTMVDKAMLAMSRTLAKLNGDMSLGVSGLGEYNAAFRAFNSLVEAGVTSGETYEAALTRLQAAHRGLSSDTAEGQRLITQLGIQMDTATQKIGLTAVAENNLANSQEALNEATVNFYANSIPTLIAGLGSLSTTMTDIPKAAHNIKLAFGAISAFMTASVIPSLIAAKASMIAMGAAIAPIAIPIGIAIGALAAFTAAVTAIRANIKVFDDLGVKVGDVFPQMKGFLDDARQAFINLSDGLNSAISVALGAIDQMTGGVANLQAQWTGFTDTLPKGTGELGTAGQAMGQLGHITSATGEQINIGAGKWQNMNGTLVAFNGAVKVAAGGWHELADGTAVYSKSANEGTSATVALGESTRTTTTAMDAFGATGQSTGIILKEQSANYSELSNAQKLSVQASNAMIESLSSEAEERYKAFLEADKYLRVIEGINPAVGLSMAAITGMAQGLREEAGAHAEAVTEAAAYIATKDLQFLMVKQTDEAILAYAEKLKEEEKALGKATEATAKHVEELNKLHQALVDGATELAFYSEASNMAARMQLEFRTGIQEAQLAVIDQTAELANNTGELLANIQLLQEGTLQEIAYSQGVIEAGNAVKEKVTALSAAIGAYAATNKLIQEAGLLALDMATGFMEAKTAVQAETEALHIQAGALMAWNDEATRAQAELNALMKGWLDQKEATRAAALEYQEARGRLAALADEFGNTNNATLRFHTGLQTGAADILEWSNSLDTAKGTAIGARAALVELAQAAGADLAQAFGQTDEQLQRFISTVRGVPSAIQEVVKGVDAMGDEIINSLKDAAAEGKDEFMDKIDEMEDELNMKFSKPLKQQLLLEAQTAQAEEQVKTTLGILSALISRPMSMNLDNTAVLDSISMIETAVGRLPASSQAAFAPLMSSLNDLKALDFATAGINDLAPIMANIMSAAENLGLPMDQMLGMFGQLPGLADMSAASLQTLKGAFEAAGFSVTAAGDIISDMTGKSIGNINNLAAGATGGASTVETAMGGIGASGDAARDAWARDMMIMFLAVDEFGKHAQVMATTVSGAYSNMSANVTASLNSLASAIMIILAAFDKIASFSQSMAGTVSGSFSNMANNTKSSMNTMASGIMTIMASFTKMGSDAQRMSTTVGSAFTTMASRVTSSTSSARTAITSLQTAVNTLASSASKVSSFGSTFSSAMSKVSSSASSARSQVSSLASAINSLKSKSITITVTTVYRTVFAAKGGAFVASSPMNVGPMKVSEFGQKELVTVTPLENPSGQTITGPGMQVSTSGPNAKAFARSGDKSISLGGPMDTGGGGGTLTDEEINKKARDFIDSVFESIEQKGVSTKKGSPKQTLIRELPIVIKIDGREIINLVNRRIFEISDSIIS